MDLILHTRHPLYSRDPHSAVFIEILRKARHPKAVHMAFEKNVRRKESMKANLFKHIGVKHEIKTVKSDLFSACVCALVWTKDS